MSFGLQFDSTGWRILLFIAIGIPAALMASLLLPMYVFFLLSNFLFMYILVLFLLLYFQKPRLEEAELERPLSLAVLIASYNSKNTIQRCISAVKKMRYPLPFRIVVVDDGSTDGSGEMLAGMDGIELYRFEKNRGKGHALNRGLEEIREDLVVCIDSDTYPEESALEKATGFFRDESVGAVNGMLLPDRRKSFVEKLQYFEYMVSFGLWDSMLSTINGMSFVTGPFTVFRRSALEKVGYYFDPCNLAEDMEIGLRLQKYNYKIKVCPSIVNETDVPNSFRKLVKQRDRWYRSRIFNLIKYRELFFRPEYGQLGFFALPYLFLLELLTLVLFLRIVILLANEAFQYLVAGGLLVFSAKTWPAWTWELVVSSQAYFFIIFGVVLLFFYFNALQLARYRFNWKDVPVMAVHILIYPFFIAAVYLRGIWHELRVAKPVWERAST